MRCSAKRASKEQRTAFISLALCQPLDSRQKTKLVHDVGLSNLGQRTSHLTAENPCILLLQDIPIQSPRHNPWRQGQHSAARASRQQHD